jgi:MtN3 and saliva related transmembrane protein
MITAVGLAAGVLTTGCWLPQLVRSWRTRSTSDFSWAYLAVLTLGIGLWLLYGILVADPAVIVANGTALAALTTLILFKLAFDSALGADSDCAGVGGPGPPTPRTHLRD